MYEDNDVLAQVLEQAREDLGENPKGLPDKPPDRGGPHAREYLAPMLLSGAIEIAEESLSEFLA
jgi:hypothetical protein